MFFNIKVMNISHRESYNNGIFSSAEDLLNKWQMMSVSVCLSLTFGNVPYTEPRMKACNTIFLYGLKVKVTGVKDLIGL